jgi:hypothetical protein
VENRTILKSLQIALFVLGLLLVASYAHAAKANPEDCPCFTVMIDAVATTECTAYFVSERHTVKLGIYEKTILFGEIAGGDCASFELSNSLGFRGTYCEVSFGNEKDDGCLLLKEYLGGWNLNTLQEKACDVALKGFKREINKLPDCEAGCTPPACAGG